MRFQKKPAAIPRRVTELAQSSTKQHTNPCSPDLRCLSTSGKIRLALPDRFSDHEYTWERGLLPRRNRHLTHSHIATISVLTIVPLIAWWLNSSAFYETDTFLDNFIGALNQPEILKVPTPKSLLHSEKKFQPDSEFHATVSPTETAAKSQSATEKYDNHRIIRPLKVAAGDTLSSIFDQQGLNRNQLYDILALKQYRKKLTQLHIGQELCITHDIQGNVSELTVGLDFNSELFVQQVADGSYSAKVRQRPVKVDIVSAGGIIDSSLSESASRAGISEKLVQDFMNVFRWDVDFIQNVQSGDRFSVVYERQSYQGKSREGHILAAEFVNQGKVYRAVRYTDDKGNTAYYDPDGSHIQKAFLRSPIEFTRITSYFGMRKHPVLNTMRGHKGVDYAAPIGTPISAIGDAHVDFVGRQRGYGKMIILRHDEKYSTLYAHMSAFAEGLKVGQKVKQGEIIGYVGKTGLATGPHLHYEFRVDGIQKDPLTVELPRSLMLEKSYREKFLAAISGAVKRLDATSKRIAAIQVANADKVR